jgi:hypothetical protein
MGEVVDFVKYLTCLITLLLALIMISRMISRTIHYSTELIFMPTARGIPEADSQPLNNRLSCFVCNMRRCVV